MKKYQYQLLKDCDTFTYSLDEINKLASKGWRVVYPSLTDFLRE